MVRDWRDRGTAYEIVRVITAPARRAFVRLEVQNAENLPKDGPAIIVANHLSFFDSILLMFALPRRVSVLGKAEYTDHAVTRWLFCGAGMIPVRRQNPGDVAHAFAQVNKALARDEVIGLFPEGTRSRDGRLHRGHSGAAHLALTTGAPLVPAGIIGTDQILPVDARLVRPFRRATIKLGEPIWVGETGQTASTSRTRRQVTDRVMSEIRRLCGQDYVDEYAPLPTVTERRPALAAR